MKHSYFPTDWKDIILKLIHFIDHLQTSTPDTIASIAQRGLPITAAGEADLSVSSPSLSFPVMCYHWFNISTEGKSSFCSNVPVKLLQLPRSGCCWSWYDGRTQIQLNANIALQGDLLDTHMPGNVDLTPSWNGSPELPLCELLQRGWDKSGCDSLLKRKTFIASMKRKVVKKINKIVASLQTVVEITRDLLNSQKLHNFLQL